LLPPLPLCTRHARLMSLKLARVGPALSLVTMAPFLGETGKAPFRGQPQAGLSLTPRGVSWAVSGYGHTAVIKMCFRVLVVTSGGGSIGYVDLASSTGLVF
jgi:hypothetical protein